MGLPLLEDARQHTLPLASAICLIFASLLVYLFRKPRIPKNAPKRITQDTLPLVGALRFFTQRIDFMRDAVNHSASGNFSFYVGQHPVVGVSGKNIEGRQVYFEDRRLGFNEGYTALLAGAPEVKKDGHSLLAESNSDAEFGKKFQVRMTAVLKVPVLKKLLPQLMQDVRATMDRLVQQPVKITDPFDSLYRLIFHCTMRTTACHEIADDPNQLAHVLELFGKIDAAKDTATIMFPWLPSLSKLRRFYYGGQLYMIFKKVIDGRKATGTERSDALQYLMDQGDSVTDIITFVLGALFAGQLNTGINAAALVSYLGTNEEWTARVREEVERVANRYCEDKALPLKERLMHVPMQAWETEFPAIDMCLKDTIRLHMCGTIFRQNISNTDIVINKEAGEVIPPGLFAVMAVDDMHMDENLYPNPTVWDPSRYLPERAEDKKETYGWMGWGVARHPCVGMRLAKLETNLVVAFFMAYFENVQVCNALGNVTDQTPHFDRNQYSAHMPRDPIHIKYQVRTD